MSLKNKINQYKYKYEIASCLFLSVNVHQLHYKTCLKYFIWQYYTIFLLIKKLNFNFMDKQKEHQGHLYPQ
jgi:hypothetical protein